MVWLADRANQRRLRERLAERRAALLAGGGAAILLVLETDLYIPHAHDIYAQTVAEFRLVGIVAGAVFLGALGWLCWIPPRDADPDRRRFGLATLFALVFMGTQQFVDFFATPRPICWSTACRASSREPDPACSGGTAARLAADR